jgi:hypothetical protein
LKKVIENTLEKILRKNNFKLADIEVNTTTFEKQPKNEAQKKQIEKPIHLDSEQMDDQEEIDRIKAKTNSRRLDLVGKDLNKTHIDKSDTNLEEAHFEVGINLKKDEKKDFIRHNMKRVLDQKSMIRLIMKSNPPLVAQNIPYLSNETRFTRAELHTLYSMYKALCYSTSQRYGVMDYDVADGIDERVFRKGVYQVFIQSDFLAKRIFRTIDYNFSNFMNWPEFIDGMQMIKAKTLSEKIGLFIKVLFCDEAS